MEGYEKLEFTGTFENDKAVITEILDEIEKKVLEAEKLFNLAKTYWTDNNDAVGNKFKAEATDMFEQLRNSVGYTSWQGEDGVEHHGLKKVRDEVFDELNDAMKNINGVVEG